ncbi:uncharacterized protein LOC119084947 [Bradysia coprophila]|uniref:uncharacterized protein LOC119084947 n=1 Tax=Bradysia coprophila TaxID=38358 RepID=UPI00187D8B1D|nr:uncharacterized protein LOC119084947 [Bradysia coprophila]
MASIVQLFIAIFVFTLMQTQVYATYVSSDRCVDDIVRRVKENHKELATDFCLSNEVANNSLRDICTYYVQDSIHKVLHAVNGVACLTEVEIPTTSELERGIYVAYVTILRQLSIYDATAMIPNSFGQLNDRVVGSTEAFFSSTASKVAGLCLHKNVADIE